MKADIKKRWAAALRSGEYKQGTGKLRKENKFCCLGVLCDIYDKERWKAGNYCHSFMGEVNGLPNEVVLWSGVSSDSPYVGNNSLMSHNDGRGLSTRKTFKQIANLIEKHL